jgi:hypothetical protein
MEVHMDRNLKVLAALTVGLLALLLGTAQPVTADEPNAVTAIDILLDPDATMVKHAEAANERLLKEFPKGFALDKTHHSHISCLQRYVKTADLDKVYEAVGKVLAEEKPTTWKLKAYKYYYIPWKDIGFAGIVIEPTPTAEKWKSQLAHIIGQEAKLYLDPRVIMTTRPLLDYPVNPDPQQGHFCPRPGYYYSDMAWDYQKSTNPMVGPWFCNGADHRSMDSTFPRKRLTRLSSLRSGFTMSAGASSPVATSCNIGVKRRKFSRLTRTMSISGSRASVFSRRSAV